MNKVRKRKFVMIVLSLITVVGLNLAYLPVSAATTTKSITITTGSDINPFIRVAMHKRTFQSGGPFTVRGEINISKYQRKKGDANVFINIVDGRDPTQMVVWMNTWHAVTDGWAELTDSNGEYITFGNIDSVLISGAFENFGLLQFGSYYVDGVISFRNFRILNAGGNVVYSWDADPNLKDITNLKNAEGDTVFALTFGDGSAVFDVADVPLGDDPGTPTASPTPTKGAVYESDPVSSAPASSAAASEPEPSVSEVSEDVSSDEEISDMSETSETTSSDEEISDESSDAVSDVPQGSSQSVVSDPGDQPGRNPLVWIIPAVLAVAAGAGALIWYFKKGKKNIGG
ncbi:MAG: hypothetical protein ACYC5K_03360 [Saccharofermentanales bacterium]